MPIWQLCANLLIPNCLRSNLSYSPMAALELYVNKTNSVLITFIIFVYYMETIDCFFVMMLLILQRYVISYMDASQRYTLFAIY